MATKTDICNDALQLIGHEASLVNVDTDRTTNAARLKKAYDPALEAALRAHPWNFATVRETWATLAAAPVWGFVYKAQLPAAYLGWFKFSEDIYGEHSPEFKIVGRELHSDQAGPLYVQYVGKVSDPTLFDPMFAQYLAARIAERIAYLVTSRADLQRDMREYARMLTIDARWANAIDTGRRGQAKTGDFLASRAIP